MQKKQGQKKQGILVAQQIEKLIRERIVRSDKKVESQQIQPASLDLRIGEKAFRVRTGFLAENHSVEEKLKNLTLYEIDLRKGGVLEKGQIYLVPLQESLKLPHHITARSNPKSSTGRLDIFTRVICDKNSRFDDIPAGYSGSLYLEVAPRSFPVRVQMGQALNQIRFIQGEASLSDSGLRELYRETPLLFDERAAIPSSRVQFDGDGGFYLHIRLRGKGPVGYRARAHTKAIDISKRATHDPADFWEPVFAPKGQLVVEPEEFYIFASQERILVPPNYAAEMLAYDVGIGELRTNYAGFFDNGFGYPQKSKKFAGTPAVLEVRAHDVPFLIEDSQIFFRLKYFCSMSRPKFLYGERGIGSYQDQGLTLAKQFAPFRER